jgi:hypothetical protein
MSTNFWNAVNKVLFDSDLILEVLDSRVIDLTRNEELEAKAKKLGKPIIYVLNKCDLVDIKYLEKKKKILKHAVFVSSKLIYGTTILKEKIHAVGKKQKVKVGVVGYPNTGKSSLINALAGRASAKASSQSGFTKGYQFVKAGNRILLLDTPGVIPFKEDDEVKHALIGSKSANQIKDPDMVVLELIKQLQGRVELYYDVEPCEDGFDTIEVIAKKLGKLIKGGEADIDSTSRMIIKDWQTGKINLKFNPTD